MRCVLGIAALALLAQEHATAMQGSVADLLDFVEIRIGSRKIENGDRIEPDSQITIQVDEAALLAAVAEGTGARITATERERLERLPSVLPLLLELEAKRLEFLRAAELDANVSFAESEEFQEWTRSSLRAFEAIDRAAPITAEDEFSRGMRQLVNAELLSEEPDFEAAAAAGQAEIQRLREQLEAHLRSGGRVSFQIRARLSGGGGVGRPIHVVGYDTHSVGEPQSVPRFQTLLDERGKAELEAAESAQAVAKAAMDGTLRRELEAARDALKEQLELLGESIQSGELRRELDAALETLGSPADATAAALRQNLVRARQLLERWEDLRPPAGASNASILMGLAAELKAFIDEAGNTIDSLQRGLQGLPQELRRVLADAGNAAASAVETTLAALQTDPRVEQVRDRWDEFRASFRRQQRYSESILALAETARELSGSTNLDTSLDLITAGDRSAGDDLIFFFELSRDVPAQGGPREIASSRIVVRLDFEGFHSVVRGALLFADARDSVSGDGDWEPVPSIGFFVHFGRSDWGTFWNDVLDPGVGLTLTLLDFDDENDLEVGIGAGVTLFDDVLWAGYGRNLQAEANYFYVGLNPLALAGLWERGSGP